MKLRTWSLVWIALALAIAIQPIATIAAYAADTNLTPNSSLSEAQQITSGEDPNQSVNNIFNSWDDLSWVTDTVVPPTDKPTKKASIKGILNVDPADQAQMTICTDPTQIKNCQIDSRVIDYLTNLITPIDQGGQGLSYIKVSNLLHGYDTNGIGKYDRETLDANPEDPGLVSTHNTGQAVDISEVGEITCKLVFHSHFGDLFGGNHTSFNSPAPVKVAWQSTAGIKQNPTPNGQSLVGSAGSMAIGSLVSYLNASGNVDGTIDLVKGIDIGTIGQYVGMNILLKNLNINGGQIVDDPLSSNVINAIGANVLMKTFAGLPNGVSVQNVGDDVRIDIGRAQIENALNLPAGTLSSYGWDGLVLSAGKRVLEQTLNLPARYLDAHSLQDLNNTGSAQGSFGFVRRTDDALNFPSGTVDLLKKNDVTGIKMAGVNLLAQALRLSDDQKKVLTDAIKSNTQPNINPATINVDNQISLDGLKSLLSSNPADQIKVNDELRNLGVSILQKASAKVVPSQYTGLTSQLLSQISGITGSITLGDLETRLGAQQLINQTDLDPTQASKLLSNPSQTSLTSPIAKSLNDLFSLTGTNALTANDITSLFKNDLSVLNKIGGAELDKAVGWTSGSGIQVIEGKEKLSDAMGSVFTNALGVILGVNNNPFTLSSSSQDYGAATVLQRLGISGIGGGTTLPNVSDLLKQIGGDQFKTIFGISSTAIADWANTTLNNEWNDIDVKLGLPSGSIKQYLQGSLTGSALAKQTGDANLGQITSDQAWDELGLPGSFQLSKDDFSTILNGVIKNTTGQALPGQVVDLMEKAVGRVVDLKSNYELDSFIKYFTAANPADQTKVMLNQGIKLLTKALGVKLPDMSDAQLNNIGNELQELYNIDIGTINSGAVKEIFKMSSEVTQFFLDATGIPKDFIQDAISFITGDIPMGLAGASFEVWLDAVNQYLPPDAQLTYQALRDSFIYGNTDAISKRVQDIINENIKNGIKQLPTGQDLKDLYEIARQELIDEVRSDNQYLISDAFLRKADSTIPVGFTKIMFSGTDAERAQMLEKWSFAHLDDLLKAADPNYVPGSLEAIFNGDPNQQQQAIILNIASSGTLSLGPISGPNMTSFLQYLMSPASAREAFFTDSKYSSMWTSVNSWLTTTLGISGLPADTAKSLFFASQNNWDFTKSLKDAQGNILVPSMESLGQDFVASKLTAWADQEFHLPAGTVFKTYQAVKAVADASKALAAAEAAGDAAKAAQASSNLSKAQASLAVFVITTAISMDPALQQLFSSVDQAIQAPPGFTNAAVGGAIAMAFHLGPAGLYIAAAIYLFGTYKVDYLCPIPPHDTAAVSSFDPANDQVTYKWGSYYDDPSTPVAANPAPGQNPFDWDNNVQFTNGSDPQLWMAWARYYTGQLLTATTNYSSGQSDVNKARQVITYRQANVEYFAAQAADIFGSTESNNPRVGMGFTQNSTRTTDWVHVGFGGYY